MRRLGSGKLIAAGFASLSSVKRTGHGRIDTVSR